VKGAVQRPGALPIPCAQGGAGHERAYASHRQGIRDALETLPCRSAIIDGEVVACKKDGTPDFRALHSGNYSREILCVWSFDLL
jgi:ATP-dependent DNA ligase